MSRNAIVILAAALVGALASLRPAHADEPGIDDPMRPYVPVNTSGADQSAAGNVVLSAVLISPSRRIAVINGQLCREGDVVADARVERIDPRSVSLRRDGELIVVALNAPRPPESTNDGDPN